MNKNRFLRILIIWSRRHIKEKQLVYFLSIIIGLIAGIGAVALKTSVHFLESVLRNTSDAEVQNWHYLVLPGIGILLTILFIKFFVKDDISHGVTKILYSISTKRSKIKKHNTYSSIIACSFTGGFGGSVGMEAPILYTGAAIGSNIGRVFNLSYKTITLLIGCGVAGALAAIFKAPITGVIFVFEVLMLDLTASSIIPLLMATVSGALLSSLLLGERIEFYFTIKEIVNLGNIHFYVLLGVITGFISLYFVKMNSLVENIFSEIYNPFQKVLIGGILLGIIIYFFPALYGEGYTGMKSILSGKPIELSENIFFYSLYSNQWLFIFFLVFLLFFKVIAMAITTGSGGVGGVFAPSLFMGAVTGFAFSKVINIIFPSWIKLSESNFTLVGMAGLIAGVMQAPLTAIFLIAEITGGYELFIPLIVTSSISYITIHYFEKHSIYTKKLAKHGNLITHDKDKALLTLMKVENVIEKNYSHINFNATLGDLVKVIAKSNRNIFPVINDEKQFMGVIMLDDIRELMFEKEKYSKYFVKDLMIKPETVIILTDNMDEVMNKFKLSNLWNLPVIENNTYIGFVSRANIFDLYRKMLIEFSND